MGTDSQTKVPLPPSTLLLAMILLLLHAQPEALIEKLLAQLKAAKTCEDVAAVVALLPPQLQDKRWQRVIFELLDHACRQMCASTTAGCAAFHKLVDSINTKAAPFRSAMEWGKDSIDASLDQLHRDCVDRLKGAEPALKLASDAVLVLHRFGRAEQARDLLTRVTKPATKLSVAAKLCSAADSICSLELAIAMPAITALHQTVHGTLGGCKELAASLLCTDELTQCALVREGTRWDFRYEIPWADTQKLFEHGYLVPFLSLAEVPDIPFDNYLQKLPPVALRDRGAFKMSPEAWNFIVRVANPLAVIVDCAIADHVRGIDVDHLKNWVRDSGCFSPFQLQCLRDGLDAQKAKRFWCAALCYVPLVTDLVDRLAEKSEHGKAPDDKILSIKELKRQKRDGLQWFVRCIYSVKTGAPGFVNVLSHGLPRENVGGQAAPCLLVAIIILGSFVMRRAGFLSTI